MWIENAGKVRALLLAALFVSIGGCDSGAAPPQAPVTASDAPGRQPPESRYLMDPERKRVWSLTRDGVFLHDRRTPAKIMEVHLPGWHWAGSPYGCLPDLALGPKGEVVVTSDVLPTLWRIDPDTLAVSVHPLALDADADKDIGFSGLAYASDYGAFFAVSYSHGSLWRIDPLLTRAQKIPLSAPVPKACALAVRPRIAQQTGKRPAGLCVVTPQGSWATDLAPDQRSAYLRTESCTAR